MALTGLQIQKLLPKTNCKECGSNTCLAFAMKLAAKKADLSECPYASDEAKQVLGAASEPPVKLIELGADGALKLGAETVLYRHEKTFVHQTALAVNINDTDNPETVDQTLAHIRDYVQERVGEQIRIDMVSITQKGNDPSAFVDLAQKAWDVAKRPLVLRSSDVQALTEAAKAVRGSHSVLASANPQTVDSLRIAAQEYGHALAVTSQDLNKLVQLASQLKEDGFNNLILDFQTHSLSEKFQTVSIARRSALKENHKSLGYPFITFLETPVSEDDDLLDSTFSAVTEICKYGGICVLPTFDPAQLAALMTLRLNIYTDPQKPIQVEPKLYAIGEPNSDSPVFVTTNFSLTYFIVSGEIENSGISAWLLVPECEGMSVLTAWAAGKFSGATIGKFAKEIGLDHLVTARDIVIPGYVAQISGELEENLPGWRVLVGPQDASDLESFIKARIKI
ncbi:MAG: acetyl-CoA decarbonylase/synthase complex subunit gamma [Candidatus Omnitrophota bacterium]